MQNLHKPRSPIFRAETISHQRSMTLRYVVSINYTNLIIFTQGNGSVQPNIGILGCVVIYNVSVH